MSLGDPSCTVDAPPSICAAGFSSIHLHSAGLLNMSVVSVSAAVTNAKHGSTESGTFVRALPSPVAAVSIDLPWPVGTQGFTNEICSRLGGLLQSHACAAVIGLRWGRGQALFCEGPCFDKGLQYQLMLPIAVALFVSTLSRTASGNLSRRLTLTWSIFRKKS